MNSAHRREVRARTDDDLFGGYLDRAAAGLFDARLEVMQSIEEGKSVKSGKSSGGSSLQEVAARPCSGPFRDLHLNVLLLRRTLFLSPRLNKQLVDQQRIGVLEMSDESFSVIAQLLLR